MRSGSSTENRGGARNSPKVLRGIAVGLIGGALAAALWLPGTLELFEAKTFDLWARAFKRTGAATNQIALILLDQESLEWGRDQNALRWPWPRVLSGMVADFCRRSGAKALVLDVGYTEPSWYPVPDDEDFGKAIAENGKVVAAVFSGEGKGSRWPAGVPEPPLAIDGLDAWVRVCRPRRIDFPVAAFPVAEVAAAARVLASTNQEPDTDGVYRRARLFSTFDGRVTPSEALAAFVADDPSSHTLAVRPGAFVIDGREIPIDSDGKAIIRYRGPSRTHATYSMAAVLQSELRIQEGGTPTIDPAELRDKYVFLGYSAGGTFDQKSTPMPGTYYGVEINATMLDNLLSGDFMRDLPLWAGIVMLVILCVAAGIAISSVSKVGWSVPIYVLFLLAGPALGVAGYAAGYWVQVVALLVGLLLTLVGGSLANYATEGKQKRFIKGAFQQYLSPTVIEQIIAHPERLKLAGEKRELSIYFSDLEDFTSLSETMDAVPLAELMNDYLSPMTDIIQEEGGTLDKYIGDAIVAFWNAPLEVSDHAVRAARAALRCQEKLAELRPAFRERCRRDLRVRIGLNLGTVNVGNMGSHTRFAYTMIGDAVNLASRLEGANKTFRTYTMMSGALHDRLGGAYPARELSTVTVKGREKKPLVIYEPMTAEQYEARHTVFETFDRGLRLFYEGRFTEAIGVFEGIAADDPPAAAYIAKCRELEKAHAGSWTGVWNMTEK
jgi:adenylate cyclase